MPAVTVSERLAKRLNVFVLLASIAAVLVHAPEKEIWYDETVSILISKGISHDSPSQFASADIVGSPTLHRLNTLENVYRATVRDNGNSILYNIALHWFTAAFGNSIRAYTFLSRLGGIATLIVIYAFANVLLANTLLPSIAVLLLMTDVNFLGMSHEIRAYSFGMLFIALAGLSFYRFAYVAERPMHLCLAGLFSAAAFLCHYLSAYVILVFLGHLAVTKRSRLLSRKNAAAMLMPAAIVGAYLYFSIVGLALMRPENEYRRKLLAEGFRLSEVARLSARHAALDFKVPLVAFDGREAVAALSLLLLVALYAAAVRLARSATDKRNLHLLFMLGASGTVLLALVSVAVRHYAPLYPRYHSFSAPFSCLFAAYVVYIFATTRKTNPLARSGMVCLIALPSCALFVSIVSNSQQTRQYNHPAVADAILAGRVERLGVPGWRHAFLVHSFLPRDYPIVYERHGEQPHFALRRAAAVQVVPVVAAP